jgi:hypothetical protein
MHYTGLMAFTRFHDDPARITKQLQESTFSSQYYLNTPGPGVRLPFQDDVQLRLQKWGANMLPDTVNLESELRGIDRPLNRNRNDNVAYDATGGATGGATSSPSSNFPVEKPFVEESRSSHPAWMYRNLPEDRWSYPQLNPQNLATIEKPFAFDTQTRILARDYYRGVDDLSVAEKRMPSFQPRNIFPLAGEGHQ